MMSREVLVDHQTLAQIADSTCLESFWENEPDPRTEERAILANLITNLSKPDRELYHLRFTQGKSLDMCASVLQCSQSTISFLVDRLIRRIAVYRDMPHVIWDDALDILEEQLSPLHAQVIRVYIRKKSQESTAKEITKTNGVLVGRSKVKNIITTSMDAFELNYYDAYVYMQMLLDNRDILERRSHKDIYR